MSGPCELCGRQVAELTRHHLIPRTRQHNKRVRREFARAELKGAMAWLCRACHAYVHARFAEKTLERQLPTIHALAAQAEVARFVSWIRSRPPDFRPTTQDARRKR